MFTLAISYLTTSNLPLIHGPNIPGYYAILSFTASEFIFTTRHIHKWVSFPLWLRLFILSGAISLLLSSSIVVTYQPGVGGWLLIFQCHIFLPFNSVHGVLKARILMSFAIPFSSGPLSVRPLHHDLSCPHTAWLSFIELDKAVVHVIILASCPWV